MNNLKYRLLFSLSLIVLICLGGVFYSQGITAKNFDLSLFINDSLTSADNSAALAQSGALKTSKKIVSDSNTKLFLNFDNNLIGEQGETPVSASGFSYQAGVQNQSIFLGNPNQLTYPSQDNVNPLEGTFEFWIKPNWDGNDGIKRTILKWGDTGGILFNKDGNSLRVIFNRFGLQNEKDITFDISNWQANKWYFVAFTYSNTAKIFKIYINGELKNSKTFSGELPNINTNTFNIGSDTSDYLVAQLDEFIISDTARSEQEISQRYLSYDLSHVFSSLVFSSSPIIGGQTSTATVTLLNPPLNDLTVGLSTSDAAALSVPMTVTIPANTTSATFPITTNAVLNNVLVTVTATSADRSISAQVNVVPPCQTTLPPQIISLWSGNDNGLDSVGAANQSWSSFADGKVGRAFSFASNNRLSTGFSKSVQEVPNFTFEAWIRPTSLNGGVLDDTDDANRRSKSISLSNGVFRIYNGISGVITTNFSADLDQWQHIALVITPTTIYFYKNGVRFSTSNNYNTILRNPGTALYIGQGILTTGFTGQIDEAAIYNRALSQTEIQAIYETGSLGKCYTSELQSLTLDQTIVETGSAATGTITLANAAPIGGAQISLINSDELLATIPTSVTIPAGESQISFPINTLPSTRIKTLNINAVYQSSVRSALLTVTSRPDLQVTNINSPIEAITGSAFNVNAQITNTGTGVAEGNINNSGTYGLARWDDFIYFSTDNQVGNDVELTILSSPSNTLNPDQNYSQNFSVTIPPSAITQDGDYYIYVRTNKISGAPSFVRNEINTNNNETFRPVHVVRNIADLQVNNVNAPTEAFGGTQFNISWIDLNAGAGRANSWSDQVFFSTDDQIGGDISLGTVSQSTPLDQNQTVAKNLNVTIPRNAVTQDGDYFIYVKTDAGNTVTESNENNNVTFRPIRFYVTFSDLQPQNLTAPPTVSFETPFDFSWSDKNAGNRTATAPWKDKLYLSTDAAIDANDFVLGEYEFTESINPGELIVRTKNLTIPSNQGIPNGSLYLIVQTDSMNSVFEDTNENNNTAYSLFAPDLQITNSNSPAQSDTDSGFNVSWTDRNGGNWATNQTWNDRILLSIDNLPSANDIALGDFPFTNPLTPNATADRIQTISIPRSAVSQDGNYFLIIQTDANNIVNEGTNENNNFVAKPISVRKTPLPDLTIENITAPDAAFFGQTIRVQWTVKNIGNGPTNAAEWQDWYYLSSDDLPEIEDPFKAPLQNVSYLAAGESYTASADLTIPQGFVGNYKILVWTDSDGSNHRTYPFNVTEISDSNNWNLARPIQLNAPPLPDLQTTLVQAQEEVFAGQTMNLNWRVENRGDGTTPPNLTAWNDKIYLSRNTTFEPNLDRLIGSRAHDGRLLPTENYAVNSFSVNVPNDIAGNWYVFVVADGDNGISEFGNENNNDNYDREQPGSPMLIRGTPPDLIIPNTINAPTNGSAAGQITVGWTVQNQGAFDAAPNWFDTVYLSPDATLDPATDTPLATVAHSAPLGAGLTYDATANVTLPSCFSGNYYLFVFSDSRRQIFEYDPKIDAETNNFSSAKQITITSSPSDLRVTAVSNPNTGNAGQPIGISWTIANQGTGATLNNTWNDEVYLSPSATFDKAASTRIGAFTHTGALAAGASYSQTQNIVIPNTAQGNYYVFVLTDSSENVEECGAANDNNFDKSPTILNIGNSLPDLTVGNFALTDSIVAGQNVDVGWTVANNGNAAAQNSSWGDAVYFSTDNLLDANDRKLTDAIVEGGLSIGGTYTKDAQIRLPIVAPGSYFLIVKTDDRNFVFEGLGENNNTRSLVLPIEIPPVDLQVSVVNTPATIFSGQNMTVDWTVQNTGNGQTVGSQWTDSIVLSLDQIDDPTDRVIGYLQHDGALNGGESYSAATDVFVPSGLAGQYYVFIRADRNNQLAESSETNNSSSPKPVLLALAPPSDLIVTSVGNLTLASPGESATFNWTVQNTGANPANGVWTDTVYLSTDQTWDIADVLIGRQTAGTAVAPGQSYNAALTATLPAINLGNYYIIVRTDIRNRVIETNESNNTGISSGTTNVDVPELQLGVPQPTTLVTGQERFYKFNAPEGETVRVSLDGQDGASNELYTRFGQMPSRNAYDFFFDRLYEADQQLIIPNTNAGNYYNMIRGENVPNNLAKTEKLDSKPTDAKQTTTAENVTVKAEIVPFSITSVSPNQIGDNGQVTITLKGAKFEEGATVKLVQGNTVLNAAKVILVDSATVKARFFFTNAPHGIYDVILTTSNNQFTILNQSLTIETATSLKTIYSSSGDLNHRIGRPLSVSSAVTNISNVDVPYVVVVALCSPYAKIGWQRPETTLPKQSDFPTVDWTKNSPTTIYKDGVARDAFIIKDMEPNQQLVFTIYIRGLPFGKSQFFVNTGAYSSQEFIERQRSSAESLRQIYLSDPHLSLSPYLLARINDKNLWWQGFKEGFSSFGIIDFTSDNSRLFLDGGGDTINCILCLYIVGVGLSTCELGTLGIGTVICLSGAGAGTIYCARSSDCGPPDPDPDPPPPPDCSSNLGANKINQSSCQPPPPPPGCSSEIISFGSGASGCGNGQTPSDPNEKIGLVGFGVEKYTAKRSLMPYTINFENIPTATASAQRVRVTDQLDPNVDPRTFRLKEIGFGGYRLQVPENRAFYQQRIQLGAEFNNILADISAGVDISTGKVTWTLSAIDPATGEQPTSANLGLLAPNDETGRGQGFVTYTVQPKQNAPTGTVIRNNATIIFDTEEPITTNTVTNTLDADIPTSAVNALPQTQPNTTFTVSWSGTDLAIGSGLQSYDIWVSENDGAYQPFVSGTTDLTAQFTGVLGKTYRFYSIARDNAGNVEAAPATPDATMTLRLAPTAANVTLSGRVRTVSGGGISNAKLLLTDQQGNTRTASTNSFGYFSFDEIPAGAIYVISISHRRYRFALPSRVLNVTESIDGLDFEAEAQ